MDAHAQGVDRLTCLPPELISRIFDFIDDRQIRYLARPICKTLLPYTQQRVYRQVEIDSSRTFDRFFRTSQSNRSLGHLVRHFSVPSSNPWFEVPHFAQLLRTQATMVYPKNGSSARARLCIPDLYHYLPFLTSLSYSVSVLSAQETAELEGFRHLVRLELTFRNSAPDSTRPRVPPPPLPQLKTLKLESTLTLESVDETIFDTAWTQATADFVNSCSSLTHLILFQKSEAPRYWRLLSRIDDTVTSSLTSLSLLTDDGLFDETFPTEEYLPDFENLEFLDLEEGNCSEDLPDYLRQLSHLRVLQLGTSPWLNECPSIEALATLVSGPDQIVTLKELVLDGYAKAFYNGFARAFSEKGRRVDVGDYIRGDLVGYGMYETDEGWQGYDEEAFPELEGLLTAGRKNGVNVRGNVLDYMDAHAACRLEEANRLVLLTHQTKSSQEYLRYKAEHRFYHRLPDLDFDKLDLEHLKLVKIDLPEEGWFQLSLE